MSLKHRVEWVPRQTSSGILWWARCYGSNRGFVRHLSDGLYVGHAVGSKNFRGTDLHQVARRVVAHINNIYPSQLPR